MNDIGLSPASRVLPAALLPDWDGALITPIKEKDRAAVYLLHSSQREGVLKKTPKGQLEEEAVLSAHLSGFGLCPAVLAYFTEGAFDYLLLERVPGEDAASDRYLAEPERLTDVFAASLARFHLTPTAGIPRSRSLASMMQRAAENYRAGRYDKGLLRYSGHTDPEAAYCELLSLFLTTQEDPVVIHGDYCLPNVMLRDFETTGFVDVGFSGTGDRHYDLFWGIWSLHFNLGSLRWTDRFLDAYGRELVDPDRLRLCGLFSAFNGYRGHDLYE
ncbi:aminoglycoside phosphotransferase APH(3') [Paenibacillus sp. J31TS4]|uniref:aminoglycoside 3'-phosphotransferase n=1 Tax=Paenibacillus sp. J31TS4 TaxID=2807195 RepID=UPI001B016D62|nr:aminoglycoside 3'-phosphotransferase [Paenibacillus sp. J31TS4]GIP36917.1 aminoglycoside phosphotransferase APH(3') [Paenibacillus sp. J31TS4]